MPPPAFGLYIRHVRGLRLAGIRLRMLAADDPRPAMVLDDTPEARLENLDAETRAGMIVR